MNTEEQIRALREALAAARACILLDRTSVADCHAAPDGRVDEDGAAALEDYDAVLAQIDAAAPLIDALEAAQRDAERYRWLRSQHEGLTDPLQMDADGFPMPQEPTALAFTVFRPDPSGMESLVPVGCIPGELDAAIDAALTNTGA